MSELYKLLIERGLKTTAIVGMTKNVGKTVSFNYLVRQFELAGTTLGLISAGYDGERYDRLTLKDKPRIYAPEGAIIATAKACFETAEAGLELIEPSSFSTPLGEIYLARVKRAGLVELAGPVSVNGLKELLAKMTGFGTGYVLVDGAINRLASASPLLTKATILATGAALGPTMNDIIRKTLFRRALLETPLVYDQLLLKAAEKGLESGNAVLLHREGDEYRVEPVRAMIPLLAGAQLIAKCIQGTAAFVFSGALVDGMLLDVMKLNQSMPLLIVQDATRLFITPEIYYRFINQGGRLMVLKQLNLIAVTLNPTDPCGRGYDPQMFLEKMTEVLSPCPVFDLVFENN